MRTKKEIDGVIHYQCTAPDCERADQWIPETDFYEIRRKRHSRCGRQTQCKRCYNDRNRGAWSRRTVLPVRVDVAKEPKPKWFADLPKLQTPGGAKAMDFLASLG